MSQALATGVSTGTSLAVFWKVLEGFAPSSSPVLSLCPVRQPWDLHWPSLVLGLLLGLVLGPVLEALVCLRVYLHQLALQRFVASSGGAGEVQAGQRIRPLHRLA